MIIKPMLAAMIDDAAALPFPPRWRKRAGKKGAKVLWSKLRGAKRQAFILARAKAQTRPLVERFWKKVAKGRGCWEWKGAIRRDGYGVLSFKGRKLIAAHRAAWLLAYGELPAKFVCHSCDNKRCVRPSHLFEGTAKDNHDDMTRKGRNVPPPVRRGADHWRRRSAR